MFFSSREDVLTLRSQSSRLGVGSEVILNLFAELTATCFRENRVGSSFRPTRALFAISRCSPCAVRFPALVGHTGRWERTCVAPQSRRSRAMHINDASETRDAREAAMIRLSPPRRSARHRDFVSLLPADGPPRAFEIATGIH